MKNICCILLLLILHHAAICQDSLKKAKNYITSDSLKKNKAYFRQMAIEHYQRKRVDTVQEPVFYKKDS